jgi:hypothetical protein
MADVNEFSILTPTPMLGYGFPLAHFWHGMTTYKPTAIIVDSGSTDPGPYLMGTGLKLCSKSSYIRDLTPILEASSKYGTKVLISSAGGDGTNAHVEELFEIIQEIATDKGYNFKVLSETWHIIVDNLDRHYLRRNSVFYSDEELQTWENPSLQFSSRINLRKYPRLKSHSRTNGNGTISPSPRIQPNSRHNPLRPVL